MKKTTLILGSILLCGFISTAVHAENELKPDMKAMGKSFTATNKAEDIASLKKELTALRDATSMAQKKVPDHLKNQPADSTDRKLYVEGMSKLLTQIDASLVIAANGNFEESKASLAKIKAIQGEYHKKLKP